MKHLLSTKDLSRDDAIAILDLAEDMAFASSREVRKLPALRGKTVVNLFFEDSTRTKTSFEAAARMRIGLLRTIVDAWYAGANASSSARLITRSSVSLVFSLPLTFGYAAAIPFAVWTSRPALGEWLSRNGICALPEEHEPIREIEDLKGSATAPVAAVMEIPAE